MRSDRMAADEQRGDYAGASQDLGPLAGGQIALA
jgi:hypothetical protein